MRVRQVELVPPVGGVVRSAAYQDQAPYTTPDASNVLPFDAEEGRARLGQRCGVVRATADEMGSGAAVRMIASVGISASGPILEAGGSFPGTTLNSAIWSAASWATDGAPALDGEGNAYADTGEYVGAVLAKASGIDVSRPYEVILRCNPGENADGEPGFSGQFEIDVRMDDTTPDVTADGVRAVITVSNGTYSGVLQEYIGGVLQQAVKFTSGTLTVPGPADFVVLVNGVAITVYFAGRKVLAATNVGAALATETRVGFCMRCFESGTGFIAETRPAATVDNILQLSDGSIIITNRSGDWLGYNRIAKIGKDGVVDDAFSANAMAVILTTYGSNVRSVAEQADGKILVSLDGWWIGPLRLNADGTEDTAFTAAMGDGGNTAPSYSTGNQSMALQSDGKILYGGRFTEWDGETRGRLIRLNSDGSEDATFAANIGTGANDRVTSVVVLSSGNIIVSGTFTDFNGAACGGVYGLESDGTDWAAFNTAIGTGCDVSGSVWQIEELASGDLILTGDFPSWNGNVRGQITKLSSTGTEDATFASNIGAGFTGGTTGCIELASGRLLVFGWLNTFDGVSINSIVQLSSDGVRNSIFNTNLGAVTAATLDIMCAEQLSDGQILIGGAFTAIDSVTTEKKLAIINEDGVVLSGSGTYDPARVKWCRNVYHTTSLERGRESTLLASAGGTVYRRLLPGLLTAVSSNLSLATDRSLQAVDYQQQLYVADCGEIKTGTDGVLSSGKLDAASVSDWTALGIDIYNFGVELTAGTVSANDAFYTITAISATDGLTLSPVPADGNTSWRIARAPKVVTPTATGATLTLLAASTGSVPLDCPLLALYLDCLVWGGSPAAPHQFFISRQGDVTDYDYSQTDAQAALSGATGEAGQVGEALTALIPWSDSYLVMGCLNSLWVLRGHPGLGGTITSLSHNVGIIGKHAWCHTPEGDLVFLARDGIYVLPRGASSAPVPMSRIRLPRELIDVKTSTDDVCMGYDPHRNGVLIVDRARNGDARSCWWIDWGTKSFWKVSLPSAQTPGVVFQFMADFDSEGGLLLGGQDGYLRRFDNDAATDDGTAIASYFDWGPIRLAGISKSGMAVRMTAALDVDSGPVDYAIRTGESADAALDSTARWSGTFATGGRNRDWRGKAGGTAMVVRLSGNEDGTSWAVDGASIEVHTSGRGREL